MNVRFQTHLPVAGELGAMVSHLVWRTNRKNNHIVTKDRNDNDGRTDMTERLAKRAGAKETREPLLQTFHRNIYAAMKPELPFNYNKSSLCVLGVLDTATA